MRATKYSQVEVIVDMLIEFGMDIEWQDPVSTMDHSSHGGLTVC